MNVFRLRAVPGFAVLAALLAPAAWAVPQADLHVAVYSSGFLVDTQRQVTHGPRARRVHVKTQAKGTAAGEAPDSGIEIDRPDLGTQWILDPRSKTYIEHPYQAASTPPPANAAPQAPTEQLPTLKITNIEPKVSGPLGSAKINGFACQAYTIRLTADFTDPSSGKVIAKETLLEKLWVTDKAPSIQEYRKAEEAFQDSLKASYGAEKASFRWLVREFNRMILDSNGNPEDFKKLQTAYLGARASIPGVTVRQLAGWNWRALDPSAPGSNAADDLNTFLGAIAAGLGAPPDQAGKTPLSDADKPKWVVDLESDLGRTGPSAMLLNEVMRAKSVTVSPDFFEIPAEYRKP
jgi:hypothetical protein